MAGETRAWGCVCGWYRGTAIQFTSRLAQHAHNNETTCGETVIELVSRAEYAADVAGRIEALADSGVCRRHNLFGPCRTCFRTLAAQIREEGE